MSNETSMSPEDVRALAAAAGLPLPREREEMVAEQLGLWLAAANELNEKMRAPQHLGVTPITVFAHPQRPEASE